MPKKKRPLIRPQEAGELDPAEIRAVVRAVHVVPTVDGWQVRKSGKKRVCVLFETQDAAEKYAQKLSAALNVGIIVHSQIIPKSQFRGTLANNVGVVSVHSQADQIRKAPFLQVTKGDIVVRSVAKASVLELSQVVAISAAKAGVSELSQSGRTRKPSVNQDEDVGVVKHPKILSKFDK